MTEWFSQQDVGNFKGIGGAALGVLGACYGAVFALLVYRGRAERWVLGAHYFLICVGIVLIGAGLVAVFSGQPYHVSYPFVAAGLLLMGVAGFMLPLVRGRYKQAEQRRLGAEELRRG